MAQPAEFWVVAIPEDAGPGASLRLLDVKATAEAARKALTDLPSDITGRVAVLERSVLFVRELAVTTSETEAAVRGTGPEEET
jgi:hypothetical protein